MPTYRTAFLSDPLSPEAHERWSVVRAWLSQEGWADGENWSLTVDPTGGRSAWNRCAAALAGLAASPSTTPERRAWWSMSDNCLMLNRLVDRGWCRVVHGHPLTLAGRDAEAQRLRFRRWSAAVASGLPWPRDLVPPVEALDDRWPSKAEVVGGNLTALETLASEGLLPRIAGRVVLLESLSCPASDAADRVNRVLARPELSQAAGVALGRFSRADRDDPRWRNGVRWVGPLARWPLVGHGAEGWSIPLGESIRFTMV